MISLALVCSSLLAGSPPSADQASTPISAIATPSSDRQQYEAARAKAGRDPSAHVQLALWCEAHGLTPERAKHLAIAVLTDPRNATARGLMGLMAHAGRWEHPEDVGQKILTDETTAARRAEYNGYRAELERTADADRAAIESARASGNRELLRAAKGQSSRRLAAAQLKLGLWCERNGLRPEAIAHFTAATEFDPSVATAWRHLGCQRHKGRWMTPQAIAAEEAEEKAQREADGRWEPDLRRWKSWLAVDVKQVEAVTHLTAINDPRAVRMVWKVFVQDRAPRPSIGATVLAQINAPLATHGLVMLALFGSTPKIRDDAAQLLPARDPRDTIPPLISSLQKPIKVSFHVNDPQLAAQIRRLIPNEDRSDPSERSPFSMADGIRGALRVETQRVEINRQFEGPPTAAMTDRAALRTADNWRRFFVATQMAEDEMLLEAGQVAQFVDQFNARAKAVNSRAQELLRSLTNQQLGDDSDDWQEWWADQRGYVYERPDREPGQSYTSTYSTAPLVIHHSCFAAGTAVKTLAGPRPIESIRVGDQVLAQDTKAGELTYRPVVAALKNPPSATLRLKIGADTIVATPIHRFWKAGHGWLMARELKTGDLIRTVGGTARVEAIENDRVCPVFNLEVAEARSFFVGPAGVLVHDHSAVEAMTEPFDATPALAVATTRAN
jgi:tetratricopeptide (TPR) repeat protein